MNVRNRSGQQERKRRADRRRKDCDEGIYKPEDAVLVSTHTCKEYCVVLVIREGGEMRLVDEQPMNRSNLKTGGEGGEIGFSSLALRLKHRIASVFMMYHLVLIA